MSTDPNDDPDQASPPPEVIRRMLEAMGVVVGGPTEQQSMMAEAFNLRMRTLVEGLTVEQLEAMTELVELLAREGQGNNSTLILLGVLHGQHWARVPLGARINE